MTDETRWILAPVNHLDEPSKTVKLLANILNGANIGWFLKVANAMLDQGLV